SDNPEMMIDTLSDAICVNKFPGKERTVYTVYNRAYRTYRGEAMRIPHTDGAEYYDVWNDKKIEYTVRDGYAYLNLTVDAQSIGCVLVNHAKS
ncbi:MAG: hypothetical protein IKV16_02365, partial [Clostridia bacterium]|nr:hypothetical protein [Clostridia bacterium]